MSAGMSTGMGAVAARLTRGGAGFKTLARTEARLLTREPLIIFWAIIFPLVLLVVIGAATGSKHEKVYGGLRFIDVYTPVLMVFVFGIVALQALPRVLVSYRESGYLKRLSTTPVGALALLEVQWVLYAGICVLAAVVTAVVAKLAFSVALPHQVLGFIVTVLLTGAAMLSLGTLIGSVSPNPRNSQLIGALLFYPMMFFAGLWVPQQSMGHTLQTIGHCTPLGAAVYGVQQTMAGNWPPGWCFLCLVVWAVIGGRVALRLFRWE